MYIKTPRPYEFENFFQSIFTILRMMDKRKLSFLSPDEAAMWNCDTVSVSKPLPPPITPWALDHQAMPIINIHPIHQQCTVQ